MGVSFRVGVTVPEDDDEEEHLGEMAMAVRTKHKLIPGILAVYVHLKNNPYVVKQNITAMGCTFTEKDIPEDQRLCMEIQLWRSDLCSGVVELDQSGNIVSSNDFKLYPPAMLMGLTNDAMINRPISRFLPAAEGKAITDFFNEGFGVTRKVDGNEPSKPRSLLKMSGGRRQTAGPVNVMTVRHHSDGREVDLAVQAIPKVSAAAGIYLVIRPVDSLGGRARLWEFLADPRGTKAEKALARQNSSKLLSRSSSLQGPQLSRAVPTDHVNLEPPQPKVPKPKAGEAQLEADDDQPKGLTTKGVNGDETKVGRRKELRVEGGVVRCTISPGGDLCALKSWQWCIPSIDLQPFPALPINALLHTSTDFDASVAG